MGNGKKDTPNPSSTSIPDLQREIGTLIERSKWHRTIGWAAISAATIVILFLFGWIFLHLPVEAKHDSDAVNERISAINERLATLTTTIEFMKPDPGKRIPTIMNDNLHSGENLDLGLKTIGAVARRATKEKIHSNEAS